MIGCGRLQAGVFGYVAVPLDEETDARGTLGEQAGGVVRRLCIEQSTDIEIECRRGREPWPGGHDVVTVARDLRVDMGLGEVSRAGDAVRGE